jgi:hypothetical protein
MIFYHKKCISPGKCDFKVSNNVVGVYRYLVQASLLLIGQLPIDWRIGQI